MPDQSLDLSISLLDQVDDEELDRLTRRLRDEIDELDVEAARLAPGPPVPGAKGDPITIGGIVVALASAGVFTGQGCSILKPIRSTETSEVSRRAFHRQNQLEITSNVLW